MTGRTSEESRVVSAKTGLCRFHTENGEDALQETKLWKPASRQVWSPKARSEVHPLDAWPVKDGNGAGDAESVTAPPPSLLSTEVEPKKQLAVSGKEILNRLRRAMSGAELVELDSKLIRPMPGQPRVYFDEVRIKALADSIAAVGQVTPGIVRSVPEDGDSRTYELLDGERRLRACLSIGTTYRAMLVKVDDEAAPYVMSVIANFNRQGHTPMETSDAIARMRDDLGMTIAEVAQSMGLSQMTIQKLYSLQRLVPQVKDMLDPSLSKGKKLLPLGAAVEISKIRPEKQVELALKVLSRELSLTALRDNVMTSNDRVVRQGPPQDSFARWSRIRDRAQALRRGSEDLWYVIKKLPRNPTPDVDHPQAVAERALRQIQENVGECLRLLSAKD